MTSVVGANIVIGVSAPVSALIEAIGHSASVISNELNDSTVSIKSVSLVKGKSVSSTWG